MEPAEFTIRTYFVLVLAIFTFIILILFFAGKLPNPKKFFAKKWRAHAMLAVFDIVAIWGFCSDVGILQQILNGMHGGADIISFKNSLGLSLIIAPLILAVHIYITVVHIKPDFQKQHHRTINITACVVLFTAFGAGYFFSDVIKSSVAKAGYYFCDDASGYAGNHHRMLVYAKNASLCLEQVETKTQKSLSAR